MENVNKGLKLEFKPSNDDVMRFRDQKCVLNDSKSRKELISCILYDLLSTNICIDDAGSSRIKTSLILNLLYSTIKTQLPKSNAPTGITINVLKAYSSN